MKVSIVKCKSYKPDLIDKALKQSIENIGGVSKYVKKNQKVLLKINQLFGKAHEHAVTTHPTFVESMIKIVKDAGAIPFVGDSPAIQSLETVAKKSGIKEVCDKHNVKLIDLNNNEQVHYENGKRVKKLDIASNLKMFDVIINLPKYKTHGLCGMTLAVKNLFGCVPGKIKATYHFRLRDRNSFSDMLIDLYENIRPQLNILDGIIGMEGNGPGGGDPRHMGLILASEDAIALDTVAVDIVCQNENDVPTLLYARKRGYKQAILTNIEVIGEKIQHIKIKDFKKPKTNSITRFIPTSLINSLSAIPALTEEKCIKCGHCHQICPNDAIKMTPYPTFDYEKCIRCYCCHEICPKKAIFLKKGFMSRIIERIMKK